MTTLKNQTISGVKWNGVATITKVGVQFVSLVVLARLLAPGDFGLMGMVVVVTGFAQAFADSGLSNAIIHRQNATRDQLSSLYWLNLVVGFGIFALIWLGIPLVVGYYQEPRLVPLLRWSAVSFLIMPIGQQFQTLLSQELRFKTLALIQVAQNAAYAISSITLALSGFGVMSLVWSNLLQVLVGAGLLFGVALRSHWLPAFHFLRTDLKGFVQFGLYQMGERSLAYLATNVDYLIIGRFLGSEPLGYYTLAYNLIRLPLVYVNPAVVSVAFPAFARVQHQDDVLRRGYSKMLNYLSAVTLPIMAGMFVIAPLLVPLVYGEQWLPAVSVVQIFCLVGVWKSLGNPLGSLLLAKGKANLGFFMNLFAIIGYAISNLIGVRWGINGVALSSLIFQSVFMVPIDFYLRWLTVGMRVKEYWHAIKTSIIAALVMLVILLPLYYALAPVNHSLVKLVILVLTGAAVYVGMIRLLDTPLLVEVWGHLKPGTSPKV